MSDNTSASAKLQALRKDYSARLPEKGRSILTMWQSLEQNWSESGVAELQRMCHSLAGSGSTYGYSEITRKARDAENKLSALATKEQKPDNEKRVQITQTINKLRQACIDHATSGVNSNKQSG